MEGGNIEMANNTHEVIFFIGAGFSIPFTDTIQAAVLLKRIWVLVGELGRIGILQGNNGVRKFLSIYNTVLRYQLFS